MDLSNVTTATLSELADGTSAINGIGAHRSKPLQIALANVSGVLYVSRALGHTWLPNGIIAGGAKLPAVSVGGLAPTDPAPIADYSAVALSNTGSATYNVTYTEMTNQLHFDTDNFGVGQKVALGGIYKSYMHDAGGSTWYVVAYSTFTSEWVIFDSSTDPETLEDTIAVEYAADASRGPSFCTTSSLATDGDTVPDEASANVAY